MKIRVLDWLCCPMCESAVTLAAFREEGAEVLEGLLTCGGCGRTYPIINAIPRMLPDPLAHLAVQYHRDFFERFAKETESYRARCQQRPRDGWWDAEERTVRSYSYQWRKFKQMFAEWEQVFLDSVKPMTREFFNGRVGLDGGCGFGRSLYYAASYGAEMIGLDLSEAIEAARENTAHFPNVHLVQGDIFHPPVRRQSLDFVYSIGVLHHLPDPKGGFRSLTRLLKPGAPMFVWVYLRGRGRQIAAFTMMRAISTRLSPRVVSALSLPLAAAQWLMWIAPYKVLKRIPVTEGIAERIPFTFYERYPFRVLHTDWVDGLTVPLQNYHRPEEVATWYQEAGLVNVRIDRDWNGRALGYAVDAGGGRA
jgi:uncharacterized protein YbaR (Trm112 family)/2-polyprenyl-3-methyl-5-hydroxy-6-metoxy-1,4-benzoquinol methylase